MSVHILYMMGPTTECSYGHVWLPLLEVFSPPSTTLLMLRSRDYTYMGVSIALCYRIAGPAGV